VAAKGSFKHVRHALAAVESAPTALEALDAIRRLTEAVEALEIETVASARRQGGTWTRIGAVYGTSKQAAQRRFRHALGREHAHD